MLFLEHGTQKLFGFPVRMGGGAAPAILSLLWFAAVLETLGGALINLGLFTRPVAFPALRPDGVRILHRHQPKSLFPGAERG